MTWVAQCGAMQPQAAKGPRIPTHCIPQCSPTLPSSAAPFLPPLHLGKQLLSPISCPLPSVITQPAGGRSDTHIHATAASRKKPVLLGFPCPRGKVSLLVLPTPLNHTRAHLAPLQKANLPAPQLWAKRLKLVPCFLFPIRGFRSLLKGQRYFKRDQCKITLILG